MGFYRWGIGLYQRHLSPGKGYRCAHSMAHGGPGCSGAVLEILEAKGLVRGLADIQSRFLSCKNAADERRKKKDQKKKPVNDGDASGCCLEEALGEVDCIPDLPDCGTPDVPDCGGCDMSCTSLKFNLMRKIK